MNKRYVLVMYESEMATVLGQIVIFNNKHICVYSHVLSNTVD